MKLLTATLKSSPSFAHQLTGGRLRLDLATPVALFVFAAVLCVNSVAGQEKDADGLKNVRVRMVNGSSIRATVDSIDAQGKISGSEILNGITLNQIVSIDTGRKSTVSNDGPYLSLKFGGIQPFDKMLITEETIQIENGKGSSREFPLELIESAIFVSSETVEQALQDRTADSDSVVVSTNSGERIVRGLVESVNPTHVVLNYGGRSRPISLEKVHAIVMAGLDVDRAQGTVATISLTDGSRFVGVINNLDKQSVDFSILQSQRMNLYCNEIQSIAIQSDRVAYLSDLSPISSEEQTQYSAARPWQRDRSLLGNPIQLKFNPSNKILTFDKGIGARSYTAIVFPNDGFDTFRAVVGIDVETNGHGDCEMVVTGDGIRLWSQRIRASDDPVTIKVDVKGIEEVTLAVFPGEKFDLADHADWADARFTKN